MIIIRESVDRSKVKAFLDEMNAIINKGNESLIDIKYRDKNLALLDEYEIEKHPNVSKRIEMLKDLKAECCYKITPNTNDKYGPAEMFWFVQPFDLVKAQDEESVELNDSGVSTDDIDGEELDIDGEELDIDGEESHDNNSEGDKKTENVNVYFKIYITDGEDENEGERVVVVVSLHKSGMYSRGTGGNGRKRKGRKKNGR